MTKLSSDFSIIIPNYNGAKFITDCLQSLYSAIKKCPDSKFEIIVIDNGSVDQSQDLAKSFLNQNQLPNLSFKIQCLKSNLGFAGAVNLGIQQSQYPYVALVNNDLTMEPNWFQLINSSINQCHSHKIVTFFGTVLNREGDKFESQGLQFFIRGKCLNISNGKKFTPSAICHLPSAKLIWGAPAALIVYRKDILQQIGSFDDDFFAYEEDVDLALRLHHLGYQTLYIPRAISYHMGGATSSRMANFRHRMDAKNWIYIIIKNYSIKEFWRHFFSISEERLRNLSGLIKNTIRIYRFRSIWILPKDLLKTYGEVIRNIPKMIKKRHQIQKLIASSV